MAEKLLTKEFLRRLETLRLATKRRFAGAGFAQREGVRRGVSLEFSDFREYTPGDDLRYVDWNIYSRTEKPFIRTFIEEEDLFVYLLVDTSASMLEGEPQKLQWALRLAAALAYISLLGLDRVSVAAFDGRLGKVLRPLRGKASLFTLLEFLENIPQGGKKTSLKRALAEHAQLVKKRGVAIVLSDFMDPHYDEGLKQLVGRSFEVHAIQVLSPQELTPPYDGELLLTDAESGRTKAVSITPALLDRYDQIIKAFTGEIRDWCRKRGVTYTLSQSTDDVESTILGQLRRAGVVK